MPQINYTALIKILKEKGDCYFVKQSKGSYEKWYSPITKRYFTVAKNIKAAGIFHKIIKKDAGINHSYNK